MQIGDTEESKTLTIIMLTYRIIYKAYIKWTRPIWNLHYFYIGGGNLLHICCTSVTSRLFVKSHTLFVKSPIRLISIPKPKNVAAKINEISLKWSCLEFRLLYDTLRADKSRESFVITLWRCLILAEYWIFKEDYADDVKRYGKV